MHFLQSTLIEIFFMCHVRLNFALYHLLCIACDLEIEVYTYRYKPLFCHKDCHYETYE